ncbi:type IV pilus modification PilV family protein [Puniceibacterium confluentis]|uniref:type IV pilus modification PilV family protein n=1 Tax=Puniceibacterium confluentis TaxID=1958944 RepID=UPI0011B43EFC|nr:prepilin-type N-terminal cleavage/methylation domain-containing protein [Puniceibacterium confluentis]
MRRRLTGERGLTLLELVIAVAVLAIGTLAALRATDQSRRALAGAPLRLLAQVAAENRAEELRLYGTVAAGGLPASVTLGGQVFAVEVRLAPTAAGLSEARITARAQSGEGALLVAVLPGPGAE